MLAAVCNSAVFSVSSVSAGGQGEDVCLEPDLEFWT